MLTLEQFQVLNFLRVAGSATSVEITDALGMAGTKIRAALRFLNTKGWTKSDGTLTRRGLLQLKPYKVDNAIIMAAGLASRFAPLSYEKPKGLLNVKGEVLLERQIRQLHSAGIKDVTIVVGYKKEKFAYLEDKFGVQIVVNDDYCRYNNTSTLIRVLTKLKNTYICSSDNYFAENVFEPYVYKSYYSAVYFPGAVNEWGVKTGSSGLIKGIDHSPVDMWCMMGHVYFDKAFSKAFKGILKVEYKKPSTRKELWESVYERNVKKLPMYARQYPKGIISEFDSLDDLRRFDKTFVVRTGSKIICYICRKLACLESDVKNIQVLNSAEDNLSFRFSCKRRKYVYCQSTKTIEEVGQ